MGRESNIKFLFSLFLILHIIPLVFRDYYQIITQVNYSLTLSLILLFLIFKQKLSITDIIMIGMVFFSFLLYLFGSSGTVSALIMSAITPAFFFKYLKEEKGKLISIFYFSVKLSSFVLILFGFYFFIINRDKLTDFIFRSECFVVASINYVSLIFFSFSVLFYLLIYYKKEIGKKVSKQDRILYLTLVSSSIFFGHMYSTKTTFVASIVLLFLYLRRGWVALLLLLVVAVLIKINEILLFVTLFLGADNLSGVFEDSGREDSISFLIENAFALNYNFRDYMSYSSLLNLFFCLMPFSLIFIPKVFYGIKSLINKNYILFAVFMLCIILTLYQMDFLSIFTLFFLINYIDYFNNSRIQLLKCKFTKLYFLI